MKNFLTLTAIILFAFVGYAQTNLVPNPSFEDYSQCPDNLGQITYATGWSSSRQTPDYFNSCATSLWSSVPSNYFGYRSPASGNAYSGVIARYSLNETRESIESQLLMPLTIGTKYYVSFKVSLAGHANVNNYCGINKLGALFSTVPYDETAPAPLCNNCAQVYTDSIITDTLNWVRIKGSFISDSNYSYINIGRFNYNSNTDSTQIMGTGCNAYYFIDDIAVSEDSLYAYNYVYTGIADLYKKESFTCYPNPIQGLFTIQDIDGYIEELKIFGMMGELIKTYSIPNLHAYTVNLNDLQTGIYYITVSRKNLPPIKKSIIKL